MLQATDTCEAYPVPVWAKGSTPEKWAEKGARNDPQVWEDVSAWIERYRSTFGRPGRVRRQPGLVLIGPPGTGKTALAATIFGETLRCKGTAAFLRDGRINPMLRSRMRGYVDWDVEEEIGLLSRIACVVWDDLLRFSGDDDAISIEAFFRDRYDNGQTTIITLNNDVRLPPTMRSFLDPFRWLEFKGQDFRAGG